MFLEPADSVVTLNETGSAVWSLCDGTRTVGEIINELASAYQVASTEIADDVNALVDQLVEAGFLPD